MTVSIIFRSNDCQRYIMFLSDSIYLGDKYFYISKHNTFIT